MYSLAHPFHSLSFMRTCLEFGGKFGGKHIVNIDQWSNLASYSPYLLRSLTTSRSDTAKPRHTKLLHPKGLVPRWSSSRDPWLINAWRQNDNTILFHSFSIFNFPLERTNTSETTSAPQKKQQKHYSTNTHFIKFLQISSFYQKKAFIKGN